MDDIIILFSEKKILKTFNFQRKNFSLSILEQIKLF